MQFRNELLSVNDIDMFAGCSTLMSCNTIQQWIALLCLHEDNTTCPEDITPSSTYIAVRCSDEKVVGIIELRHNIDSEVLSTWGGHIGYTVRPSERNKGYAKEMLKLLLRNFVTSNDRLLITCNAENIASEKVIKDNGGIFEKEISVNGKNIKRYWIYINEA